MRAELRIHTNRHRRLRRVHTYKLTIFYRQPAVKAISYQYLLNIGRRRTGQQKTHINSTTARHSREQSFLRTPPHPYMRVEEEKIAKQAKSDISTQQCRI